MKPSRAMIPGEISWAFIALAYAWAGAGAWPLQPGSLYYVVSRHAHPALWGLLLGVPALLLMLASAREWAAHFRACGDYTQRWSVEELHRSAQLRGRLCLALIAGWGYMIKIAAGITSGANATSVVALGGVLFMLWFYIENRRVQREIRCQAAAAYRAAPQG